VRQVETHLRWLEARDFRDSAARSCKRRDRVAPWATSGLWWASKTNVEKDRLDILGLDREGRLVVAELKRDAAPDTVEMQAIRYTAMASRFDLDVLADAHGART
jgi:hypothetical protein